MTTPPRTRQTTARETPAPSAAPTHGRKRVRQSDDKFAFDRSIIPDGWTYEWKRYSTLGQEDPAYMAGLYQVGYTPVPSERHPGVFVPVGHKGENGCIIINGQILMERPLELEQEARQEDRARAYAQVQGSKEQFGLAPRARGFEGPQEHPSARRNSYVRSSVETVDVPSPKYETNVDG